MGLDLDSQEMFKIKWLGMFDEELIGLDYGTPAQILEHILKKKWALEPQDKDMIVMWHKFDFLQDGKPRQIQSHMVVKGNDRLDTAMSRTVGFPLGIAAKLVLTGAITARGVQIPVKEDIYSPILNELPSMGIEFIEREMELGEQ
jgi:saccharopine dehydrogenase (NADP+, L-glutamate forming)